MRIADVARAACALAAVIAIAAAHGCARHAARGSEPVTLRMGVASPSTTMSFLRTSLSRDYLLSSAEDGQPMPRLLESWAESADGLTWQLRLRAGVLFHDGSAVTASDLVPAVSRLRESIFVVSDVVDVRPVDALTLEVRLAERSSFFLEDLASIVAEKATSADESVGTGPFVVESATGTSMSLRAFPQYFRGTPAIDHVEINTYPDLRNAWSALMRYEIDFLYELSRDATEFVDTESSVEVSRFLRPYVILLGFNPSRPQFRSPQVRQALNIAIDRERLVDDALRGQGLPAVTHVWPFNRAYSRETSAPAFAPQRALALLDGAGLKPTESDGRMPARLRFKVLCYEPLERMAMAVQRQLARLDIDMQIEVAPTRELVQRLQDGDFDAFLFEMSAGRTLKWGYLFWHSESPLRPQFGIHYDAADSALDALRAADSDAAVLAGVAAFQRVLADDPPAAFLSYAEVARVISRRFEIPNDSEGDIFGSIWKWKPAAQGQPTQ